MKRTKIIACIMALVMMLSLASCAQPSQSPEPSATAAPATPAPSQQPAGVTAGSYTAQAQGFAGPVEVKATVDADGKITDLTVTGEAETPDIGGKAMDALKETVLRDQTVKVDAVTGATVTSTAVIEALTDALKQAGVDTDAMEAVVSNVPDEVLDTDIVIVGAGASGMTAALAAAEKGVKVTVVEQTASYGGTALMGAEGFFAVESEQQKRAGWNETVMDLLNWFTGYTHNVSNAALTRKYLELTADTVEWVGEYGNPATLMENTQLAHKDQIQTYHKFDDKKVGFKNWYDNMVKNGVNVIFDTKVTELIQAEDGTVSGVIGNKTDGGKLVVNAKAVILSTGGFMANAEMVEKYIGFKPGEYDMMTYGTTGEGVTMAIDAGADTYGIGGSAYHGAMLPNGASFSFAHFMMTPTLWVDGGGNRFTNEEVVYDFALWGNATYSAGGSYWSIVDKATLDKFASEGTPYTHSFMKTILVDQALDKSVFPSVVRAPEDIAADPKIIENLENAVATESWAVKGNTIEELAQQMGVPADRLTATINRYNEAVKNKQDDLFGKDAQYLKYDVSEGPFYALKPLILAEGSMGGISTDENLQVVRKNRSVIPGLYATGANVGMLYADSYPVMEGVNLSFALNSGRMAAYHAADVILGK